MEHHLSKYFGPIEDRRASRKARQLARQAEHALRFALSESAKAELQSAVVLMVEPAPDATRLAVTIRPGEGVEATAIEEALEHAAPYLRRAVTEAITRKRAPTLVFYVVPDEVLP
jgi:ribosome-binding factor A